MQDQHYATAATPEESEKWRKKLLQQQFSRIRNNKIGYCLQLKWKIAEQVAKKFHKLTGIFIMPTLLTTTKHSLQRRLKRDLVKYGGANVDFAKLHVATMKLRELVEREYDKDFKKIKTGSDSTYLK